MTSVNDLVLFMHDLEPSILEVAEARFRKTNVIDNKDRSGSFDPVTEADREIERVIRSAIEARWPHHSIVGEEFGTSCGTGDVTWTLDPIDGTRSFMAGLPTWGVLIAASRGPGVVAGMMLQPYTGERYSGDNRSATLRHKSGETPLATSCIDRLDEMTLATTDPFLFRDERDAERFAALHRQARVMRYGTDCYGYCRVAAGTIDAVVEPHLSSYDIAALIPIVCGAGGCVTTWSGGDASQGGHIVASANERLHEAILNALA